MFKKILCILIVCLSFNLNAEELNIRVLEIKTIDYENGTLGPTRFTILCVNGYKWLQSGIGQNQSTSQMFDDKNSVGHAQPIRCPN